MSADFTIQDVLNWARTKPADERYDYTESSNCALCQFLRDTARVASPGVLPDRWWDHEGTNRGRVSEELNAQLRSSDEECESNGIGISTFGALVARLEKLCPDAPVPPSEWTRLDAYMTDIELASA
jgi:hypothetical protein